ncbi:hypothetical protein CP10881SC42_0110 [Chlamydia avium]|uniref:Uncharacterized protein n=1 Tax=Chlamydia avium TaxID=1457141 RepID=A0ABN0MTQ4_9CHLA|nr:hypothetical protein CP10743SC13_0023 [Chlamydia psittaci 10_743_SC13]EPP38879.1 hypothetical protein CP10881SC42_0110 [Chlamydia avium]
MFISVCFGAVLGAYCQLYYLIKTVLLSWVALSRHAIAKRQALLSLAALGGYPTARLSQEIAFLTQYHSISWKQFLKYGYDILFAFKEMEDTQRELLQEILDSLQDRGEREIIQSIEDFWANDNLFAFESTAYEQAVEKYLRYRSRPTFWLVSKIFCFLDLPAVSFSR